MLKRLIERGAMPLLAAGCVLLAVSCGGGGGGGDGGGTATTVADYTVAKQSALRAIPDEYVTRARTRLHVAYFHTSHGTHVSYGVFGLPDFKPGDETTFAVSTSGPASGKLDFRDFEGTGVPYADLSQVDDAGDWAGWVEQVRAYLDANPEINVMLWSWCDITGHSVAGYLDAMQVLIDEYGPDGSRVGSGGRSEPVAFVFMTGHAASAGNANAGSGNPKAQAALILDYCRGHDYFCIDYYSIDTHDMSDVYHEDADDDSNYAGGNFYAEWQASHVEGRDWYQNRTAPAPDGDFATGVHNTQHITANRKAFAFWWVLARIAGYS